MYKMITLENEDFSLQIRKWTNKTKKLGLLAHKIIGDELGIKEKTTSYLKPKKSDKVPKTHSSNSLKRDPNGRFKTMLPKEDLIEKVKKGLHS